MERIPYQVKPYLGFVKQRNDRYTNKYIWGVQHRTSKQWAFPVNNTYLDAVNLCKQLNVEHLYNTTTNLLRDHHGTSQTA